METMTTDQQGQIATIQVLQASFVETAITAIARAGGVTFIQNRGQRETANLTHLAVYTTPTTSHLREDRIVRVNAECVVGFTTVTAKQHVVAISARSTAPTSLHRNRMTILRKNQLRDTFQGNDRVGSGEGNEGRELASSCFNILDHPSNLGGLLAFLFCTLASFWTSDCTHTVRASGVGIHSIPTDHSVLQALLEYLLALIKHRADALPNLIPHHIVLEGVVTHQFKVITKLLVLCVAFLLQTRTD